MAIRSRRLRKKLRVDEFQELGFDVSWRFADSLSEDEIDAQVDRFIAEVIEPRELGFHGGGHRLWDGVIATQRLGKCTDEDRQAVVAFLESLNAQEVEVSALYDIWWG
ncbi:50S ribosome-binding protein YggL [Shewanella sp. YIC-542]|uniref:50S ribosome-binding protein YggL n=1 Tax=Shewanella mytili TaxID=3377111 RepID=UPI00398F1659